MEMAFQLDLMKKGLDCKTPVPRFDIRQSMVAITEVDCTGCYLCIPNYPFEAFLPLAENPTNRKHKKRPIVVLAAQCVGCLSCIGSCPTKALHEILLPPISTTSPLLISNSDPETESIKRWGKKGLGWA